MPGEGCVGAKKRKHFKKEKWSLCQVYLLFLEDLNKLHFFEDWVIWPSFLHLVFYLYLPCFFLCFLSADRNSVCNRFRGSLEVLGIHMKWFWFFQVLLPNAAMMIPFSHWVMTPLRAAWLDYLVFSSVQLLSHVRLFVTHGLQHASLPCPSPTPGACSNSCPSSRWCHPTISSSVIPFSSCIQGGSLLCSSRDS